MERGYITLHRKIMEWEWYQDANTFRLFMHCLLKCNHEDKKWQGQLIERGSFITSNNHLATELHLSVQQIRTSLKKLEETKVIIKEATSKRTVIKVQNYDDYQSGNKPKKEESKIKQTQVEKDNFSEEEYKEWVKNQQIEMKVEKVHDSEKHKETQEKQKKPKEPTKSYGEYKKVKLTDKQYEQTLEIYGEEHIDEAIRELDTYCETHGKTYKNYYAVLNGWVKDKMNDKYKNKSNDLRNIMVELDSDFLLEFDNVV